MNVLAINAMLGGLVSYLGEGSRLLVYGGVQPGEGNPGTTLLAAAVLALPAGAVDNGRLSLVQADTAGDLAVATGIATWGRLVLAGGTWVADFSMSGPTGSGQVKLVVLNPPEGDPEAKLYQGGTFFIGEVVVGG